MKRTISKIDPSSAAKVISLTIAILGGAYVIIALILMALGLGFGPAPPLANQLAKSVIGVLPIIPFLYMAIAYMVIFVFCHAFNLAIRLFGGVRIDLSE